MRYFFLVYFLVFLVVAIAAGPRGHKFSKPPFELFPDMDHQPKVKYQVPSDFFADGMGARRPVGHTEPMGYAIPEAPVSETRESVAEEAYFNTGRFGDFWGNGLPAQLEVDQAFLATGKEQYNVYCAVCHGESGNGKGPTSQFGIGNAANFHAPDFANPESPAYRMDGSLFNTITNGQGVMGAYGANIKPAERWAIIAYIRAMQAAAAAK